jgi:alpha-L-rhamnosidase
MIPYPRNAFTPAQRPVPARLHATARGPVAGGWSITGDRLTVTVPPGSTAVLEIPTADPGSVREDDAPAAGRPGVLGVETSAAGVNPRLTSGRFTFTATPAL